MGRPVTANFRQVIAYRPLKHLTDGFNIYGNILPLREWMRQLARRHELENERPAVAAELARRYTTQKENLRRMYWLAFILAAGTIITVLINRMNHQRAIHRTRERIAADLHDELGANLHAIALLSDYSRDARENPQELDRLLREMRALAERTATAAKHCTNVLEAENLYEDLVGDMRRTADRITADLDHTLAFEGEELLREISPRKRIDLFLFYKESLANIIRHASATRVATRLVADGNKLTLTIDDNGLGLDGKLPSSLKRRARLMKAHLSAEIPDNGGTRICLTLHLKRNRGIK